MVAQPGLAGGPGRARPAPGSRGHPGRRRAGRGHPGRPRPGRLRRGGPLRPGPPGPGRWQPWPAPAAPVVDPGLPGPGRLPDRRCDHLSLAPPGHQPAAVGRRRSAHAPADELERRRRGGDHRRRPDRDRDRGDPAGPEPPRPAGRAGDGAFDRRFGLRGRATRPGLAASSQGPILRRPAGGPAGQCRGGLPGDAHPARATARACAACRRRRRRPMPTGSGAMAWARSSSTCWRPTTSCRAGARAGYRSARRAGRSGAGSGPGRGSRPRSRPRRRPASTPQERAGGEPA